MRPASVAVGAGLAAGAALLGWYLRTAEDRGDVRDTNATRSSSARLATTPTPTAPAATATPRVIIATASWHAPAGAAAERYAEQRFEPVSLRYGERLYIRRICVSDPRKITMISYTDAVGHTDVPLLLGGRGEGRVDPDDRHCTLFEGIEVAKLEKCKCWFQCAGEMHRCTVQADAQRP
jgi:hypothetical protein